MRLLLFILLSMTFMVPVQSQHSLDQMAIIKTMEGETEAFFQRDYKSWTTFWIHDESVFQAWNTKSGSYVQRRGWEAVNKNAREYIERNPTPSHSDFYQTDMIINIEGDIAYLSYYEYASNRAGDMYTKAPGFKVLRRENGSWKFVSVASYWDFDYRYTPEEVKEIINADKTKNRIWTEADRQYLIDNLDRTTELLHTETKDLTDAQWHFKEKTDSWSIGQVMEHLSIYERLYYVERYRTSLFPPEPELNATTHPDEYYIDWMGEEQKHSAPGSAKPLGLLRGKDNWTSFMALRNMTIEKIKETDVDFRAHFCIRADGVRWNIHQLYVLHFAHCDRHLRQIIRIKSHKDFPGS